MTCGCAWRRMAASPICRSVSWRCAGTMRACRDAMPCGRRSRSASRSVRQPRGEPVRSDPAAALAEPPDWWAVGGRDVVLRSGVGFYRFLDSDRTAAPQYLAAVERRLFDLNHVERKLAQARLGEMLDETRARTAAPADRGVDRVTASGTGVGDRVASEPCAMMRTRVVGRSRGGRAAGTRRSVGRFIVPRR